MANALGRQLKNGEVVFVRGHDYRGNDLAFVCEGGAGMKADGGPGIVGHWLTDEEPDFIYGHEIDPEGTLRFTQDILTEFEAYKRDFAELVQQIVYGSSDEKIET